MKVYFDACCVNRLTDDQTQPRIQREAEAIEFILRRMRDGEIEWISSLALADEIDRNPHVERRLENVGLLALASETVEVNNSIAERAADLQITGYGAYDALHWPARKPRGLMSSSLPTTTLFEGLPGRTAVHV